MLFDVDVRAILPAVQVPTLGVHRAAEEREPQDDAPPDDTRVRAVDRTIRDCREQKVGQEPHAASLRYSRPLRNGNGGPTTLALP
ncbi:hypothetical protein B4Q13_15370 [Lacticaseibacillus rhamnosus]